MHRQYRNCTDALEKKVRPANVLGADADLTEIATNRKKTTAANLDALVYDR